MKTIGLIGGTGWVSTVEYYRLINQEINNRLGGSNSAKCLIHSFNFGEILRHQENNNPEAVYSMILHAINGLTASGADCVALCANTMHRYASRLTEEISIPLIHIAKATSFKINKTGLTKVGLLGTNLTMELDFYSSVLNDHGITTLIPTKPERDFIHSTIFDELLKSQFRKESRLRFLEIIDHLVKQGAQGIVLGCTEIPLLIQQKDTDIPLFNTLDIHTTALVNFALSNN